MVSFKVVIIRPDRNNTVKDGLSKKEAEDLAQVWRDDTFNADNYLDPVPKVVVMIDRDGE